MGSVVAAVALAAALASAQAGPRPLESRALPMAYVVMTDVPGENFDLFDVRAALKEPPQYSEVSPHTIFGIKRHVGFAAGYDQGVVHGSIGLYVTVAEWGRWNFGAPSPAIGFGRYSVYDPRRKEVRPQFQSTILVSLASIHYRGGYLRSIGKVWYVNFEQIFDARANLSGSQVGISFANH